MMVTIGKALVKAGQYKRGTGYAADVIVHEVDNDVWVDVGIEIAGGYTIPMPVTLHWTCKSEIVHSRYYSGIGGNNYHCRVDSDLGESRLHFWSWAYKLQSLVDAGEIRPNDNCAHFLKGEKVSDHGLSWEQLRQME